MPCKSELEFVPASATHYEDILSTLLEAKEWLASKSIHQWQVPWSMDWVRWMVSVSEVYCVYLNGTFVGILRVVWSDVEENAGYSVWETSDEKAGYVHSLAVRRAFAGRGIGAAVMRWAEEKCLQNGAHFIRLDCLASNLRLCTYYEDQGFVECGEEVVNQYHARLYEKRLTGT